MLCYANCVLVFSVRKSANSKAICLRLQTMIQEIDQDCERITFGPIISASKLNGLQFTNATNWVASVCYSREFSFDFWYLVFTCIGWPILLVIVVLGVLEGVYANFKVYFIFSHICVFVSAIKVVRSFIRCEELNDSSIISCPAACKYPYSFLMCLTINE